MNKKEILIAIAYVICTTLLVVSLAYGCDSTTKNPSNATEHVRSEFTSNQDVIDYCRGTVFTIPYLGISTVADESNVVVKSFTSQTAIVSVLFDMTEILGRATLSGHTFKIDKQAGTYEAIYEE